MPEVCEVALTAEILSKHLKGKEIINIEFVSGRYGPNRTKPVNFLSFKKKLPMKITRVDSKGKFLWFELENDTDQWTIWNTLGLTGMWSVSKVDAPRLVLTTSDNKKIYYEDARNFGTFKFSSDMKQLIQKLKTLGPDFLKGEKFKMNLIKNKRNADKNIISILMDQKKIGSGIGNYLSVEILYRAKISPLRKCENISDKEIESLEYWIKYLVKLCYESNYTGYMEGLEKEAKKIKRKNYHSDIIIEEDDFEYQVYRRKTDPKGNKVVADKIIKGRTTYWVPNIQK